jgi:hypothetical protein
VFDRSSVLNSSSGLDYYDCRAEPKRRTRKSVRKTVPSVLVALAFLRGAPALAQSADGGPDPATVRVRIGPLMMNPTISISNLGIDHNVFNDPPDRNPKEDFTFTVTPISDFWLHLGPTWLTASINESVNWYQTYSSERTANTGYKLGWHVPGSRVSLQLDAAYLDARERPGFEIDARAERHDTNFTGTLEFHALPKSYIGITAARQDTRFADQPDYLGTDLRTSLSRVDSSYGASFRHQLTPLTSIALSATRSDTRFAFSPDRDTVSNSALASVKFDPAALLKGGFSLGYNDFKPTDSALPAYRGFVGNVDLTYVLLGSTRFAVTGSRGVQYSYDDHQPYYVQSRIGASIAQQIFGPFDVEVRGDIASLDYRNRAGVVVTVADRTDRVNTVGVGVGYHIGKDLRISVNADQTNRDSELRDHQYKRLLVGSALTYGF